MHHTKGIGKQTDLQDGVAPVLYLVLLNSCYRSISYMVSTEK